jgi:L-lactate dehydrogenase complex protein LldE
MTSSPKEKPRVALFVTCLVDLFRPSVGFAAAKLLEDAGCDVFVPVQTCCGQPAYNSGDRALAKALARQAIEAFAGYDYIVAPSGSCAAMLAKHYPGLFADDPNLAGRANEFAAKVHELASFLTEIRGVEAVDARFERRVTFHDSCSGLRELGIAAQPRTLLQSVEGLELIEMEECDTCCGFGGTFAIKFGELSAAIVERKVENIEASGVPVVLAGDLGCLMNMAGKLAREGSLIELRHFAEVLAEMTETPGICAAVTPSAKL